MGFQGGRKGWCQGGDLGELLCRRFDVASLDRCAGPQVEPVGAQIFESALAMAASNSINGSAPYHQNYLGKRRRYTASGA